MKCKLYKPNGQNGYKKLKNTAVLIEIALHHISDISSVCPGNSRAPALPELDGLT